jgi:hypothetical protein
MSELCSNLLKLFGKNMLPPVLEIYVVWHPKDERGQELAESVVEHFHGTSFTGLIGGAIEVFIRSAGWTSSGGAPRPIPYAEGDLPGGINQSEFVVVVPIMGVEMASALETEGSEWSVFISAAVAAHEKLPNRVGIFPYLLDRNVLDQTRLGALLGKFQRIAASRPEKGGESEQTLMCRDLAQGITQLLAPQGRDRLTVFLSHTKHSRADAEEDTSGIIQLVRHVIAQTRLKEYFDASDLQPGSDWDDELRANASKSALFAIRTDLYPSREWCQREVRIAKQSGMPVIIMDAPGPGEERGSFLMDHVPRIPVLKVDGQWSKPDVYRALNLLVDECLKRVLWLHQERLAKTHNEVEVSWWAPHAPEPLTLINWITQQRLAESWPPEEGQDLIILHPDPPLGPDEKLVLDQILEVAGITRKFDVMTPRLLAARGG